LHNDNQQYLSLETIKFIGKKTSSSSLETVDRFGTEIFTTTNDAPTNSERNDDSCSNTNDLPTLLDHITRQYNEQIGTLINNIDRLSKKLVETKQENKVLKKQIRSSSRESKRATDVALNMPILTEFSKCGTDGRPPLSAKRKTSSMILFKCNSPKVDKDMRKVKAAPVVQHHYDKFRKRLNQINENALADYLN
jgi:hypothetical protein